MGQTANDTSTNWKDGWEYKSVKLILRVIGILFFLGYLFMTGKGTHKWIKMQWIRTYPIEHITIIAEKNLQSNTPEAVLDWMIARPATDREQMMDRLLPYAGEISSFAFLRFSQWTYDIENFKDSLFWYQYARFRLRYDALRCDMPETIDNMNALLTLAPMPYIQNILRDNPTWLIDSIQRVMAFDAEHPAQNNPIDSCKVLTSLTNAPPSVRDRDTWPAIRHRLRNATERQLKDMGHAPSK